MQQSKSVYIVIAVLSFIVLASVQIYLIFNMFKLQNEQYYIPEKRILKEAYESAISNDNLFPGAGRIVDRYIEGENILTLEQYYLHDTAAFETFKQTMLDSTVMELTAHNNLDSLLAHIVQKNGFHDNLQYALMLESIDVAFESNKYIPLYNYPQVYPLLAKSVQTRRGIRIGGKLENLSSQNLISAVVVSSLRSHSYRIQFAWYVDTENRTLDIFKKMWPILLLSIFSICGVVLLFFVTYMNWVRQRKLSDMKSDFINNITHELHTPLAAIIIANKSLRNDKIADRKENITALTDVIQRQSDRLQRLITQVLDLTASSQVTLHKEEHSVHRLMDEILLDFRLKYTDSAVALDLHKNATRDIIFLDPFWFTTLLFNVLDNAVKYNTSEEKRIVVTTRNSKKHLEISIEDNGIGISTDTQKYIFDKFYRSTKHLSIQVKGLGLGLYYVKQCIAAHHWDMQIRSQPEKGTTFIMLIPLPQ